MRSEHDRPEPVELLSVAVEAWALLRDAEDGQVVIRNGPGGAEVAIAPNSRFSLQDDSPLLTVRSDCRARGTINIDDVWPEDLAFLAELDRRLGGRIGRALADYARPRDEPSLVNAGFGDPAMAAQTGGAATRGAS